LTFLLSRVKAPFFTFTVDECHVDVEDSQKALSSSRVVVRFAAHDIRSATLKLDKDFLEELEH
jgi:hypothetical protein